MGTMVLLPLSPPTLSAWGSYCWVLRLLGASEPGPFWTGDGDREPGDLGFLPFGDAAKNCRDLRELQLCELKNGRRARLAMAAFFSQHQIPGSVPLLSGLTDI